MENKERIGKISFVAIIIVSLCVLMDQISKMYIVNHVGLYEKIQVIPGFFDITYLENTGAGFSIFEGYGKFFFGALTLIALGVMVYWFFQNKDTMFRILLAFIAGGAIGNLIDRMCLGYVRDFLSFNIFGWAFPVFNIADICISVGFVCLLLYIVIDEYQESKKWK